MFPRLENELVVLVCPTKAAVQRDRSSRWWFGQGRLGTVFYSGTLLPSPGADSEKIVMIHDVSLITNWSLVSKHI